MAFTFPGFVLADTLQGLEGRLACRQTPLEE
jgi:hypothetical protein